MTDTQKNDKSVMPQLVEVPQPSGVHGTAMTVQFGRPLPAQQQLMLYSPDNWEEFIYEWVQSQKAKYEQVLRFAGPGDMGIDVAAFTDKNGLLGIWDNYQCKHYDKPLTPGDAAGEIAKILWHSFNKKYAPPRKYYFIAPLECGLNLKKLLAKVPDLRDHVIANWDNQCATVISSKQTVALTGNFKAHVQAFDFSIFSQRTLLEILDEHRTGTSSYAVRFGGGLPDRPKVAPPTYQPEESGSRYIQQLFEAYGDHTKSNVENLDGLATRQDLSEHFNRQREFFYHAEALRNFARDTVPTGTFEELQTEVHAGVLDVEAAAHADGYVRLNAVTQAATALQLTSNALISVVKIQDRKGMCHQLANEDRLTWRRP